MYLKDQEGLQEWLYLGDLIILLGMLLYPLASPFLGFPQVVANNDHLAYYLLP